MQKQNEYVGVPCEQLCQPWELDQKFRGDFYNPKNEVVDMEANERIRLGSNFGRDHHFSMINKNVDVLLYGGRSHGRSQAHMAWNPNSDGSWLNRMLDSNAATKSMEKHFLEGAVACDNPNCTICKNYNNEK